MMKKLALTLIALAAALAIAQVALADSFTYTISGQNFSADLTFTANQIPSQPQGVDLITGVSGWFSDSDTSGRVTLSSSNPATVISADGALAPNYADNGLFLYDNELYTNQKGYGILDWYGVLLNVTSNNYQLNIFSNGSSFYWADNGAYYSNNPISIVSSGTGDPPAPGSLTPTPEPGSLLLLGSGLLSLAFVVYRKAELSVLVVK
jgi:hypothetical protein